MEVLREFSSSSGRKQVVTTEGTRTVTIEDRSLLRSMGCPEELIVRVERKNCELRGEVPAAADGDLKDRFDALTRA